MIERGSQPAEFGATEFPKSLNTFRDDHRAAAGGIVFRSRSEAAAAILFEKYIPGWRCVPGETYEVPVGGGRSVDYLVPELFVEYHPIILQREFRRQDSFREFRSIARKISPAFSSRLFAALIAEKEAEYFCLRRAAIDYTEKYKGTELAVCSSASALHWRVVSRFSDVKGKDFCAEFSELVKGNGIQ